MFATASRKLVTWARSVYPPALAIHAPFDSMGLVMTLFAMSHLVQNAPSNVSMGTLVSRNALAPQAYSTAPLGPLAPKLAAIHSPGLVITRIAMASPLVRNAQSNAKAITLALPLSVLVSPITGPHSTPPMDPNASQTAPCPRSLAHVLPQRPFHMVFRLRGHRPKDTSVQTGSRIRARMACLARRNASKLFTLCLVCLVRIACSSISCPDSQHWTWL